jgi:hypothetical protein
MRLDIPFSVIAHATPSDWQEFILVLKGESKAAVSELAKAGLVAWNNQQRNREQVSKFRSKSYNEECKTYTPNLLKNNELGEEPEPFGGEGGEFLLLINFLQIHLLHKIQLIVRIRKKKIKKKM